MRSADPSQAEAGAASKTSLSYSGAGACRRTTVWSLGIGLACLVMVLAWAVFAHPLHADAHYSFPQYSRDVSPVAFNAFLPLLRHNTQLPSMLPRPSNSRFHPVVSRANSYRSSKHVSPRSSRQISSSVGGGASMVGSELKIVQAIEKMDIEKAGHLSSHDFFDLTADSFSNQIQMAFFGFLFTDSMNKLTRADDSSSLLVAKEGEEVIGCVVVDKRVFDKTTKTICKPSLSPSPDERAYWETLLRDPEDVAVVGNLVSRRDKRGQGIARSLMMAAETQARSWKYKAMLVLVESENAPAQSLYASLGYELMCDKVMSLIQPGKWFPERPSKKVLFLRKALVDEG